MPLTGVRAGEGHFCVWYSDHMELKRCSKCKELKPRDEFSKDRYMKDGLHSSCKACKAKKWRELHPEGSTQRKVRPGEETERECNHCHEVKPITEFSLSARSRGGRLPTCSKCVYSTRNAARGGTLARDNKRVHTARQLGLSLGEYLAMIAEDCHVCGKEAADDRQNGVYVNRHTGTVTGVVCKACSQSLGFANHDPKRLRALADLAAYSIE